MAWRKFGSESQYTKPIENLEQICFIDGKIGTDRADTSMFAKFLRHPIRVIEKITVN